MTKYWEPVPFCNKEDVDDYRCQGVPLWALVDYVLAVGSKAEAADAYAIPIEAVDEAVELWCAHYEQRLASLQPYRVGK